MLVYHYCSMETFCNIIKNKTLRLADIVHSNDKAELRWFGRYLKHPIFDAYSQSAILQQRIDHRDFYDNIMFYFHKLIKYDDPSMDFACLACCFSTERDLKSQWTEYGESGKGVSIGFDADILDSLDLGDGKLFAGEPDDGKNTLFFLEVKYDEESHCYLAKNMAKILIHALEQSESVLEDINVYCNMFFVLRRISAYIKNPAFHEEREWRLFTMDATDGEHEYENGLKLLSKSSFVRRKNFVDYRDLSFANCRQSIIKEIILGSQVNNDRIKSISSFLADNEMHPEILVSESTYQPR